MSMTENSVGQVSYPRCVLKKSKQIYTLFFKTVFELLTYTVIFSIIIAGLGSLIYIIYSIWQNWYLIAERLPQIPVIPWYVYVVVAILAFPLAYSMGWCLVNREVKG